MPARKPEQDYHDTAKSKNAIWIGEKLPKNSHELTKWQCKVCDNIWETHRASLQTARHGCPLCAKKAYSKKMRGRPRKNTEKDYHDLATSKDAVWLGVKLPAFAKDRTPWQCNKCGNVWETSWYSMKQSKHGCPACANKAGRDASRHGPEKYNELATKREFKWLGPKAKNNKDKTEWECEEGHRWFASYTDINKGNGCPLCRNYAGSRNVPAEFLRERYRKAAVLIGARWIETKGKPKASAKQKWECLQCGHIWEASIYDIQNKKSCPRCSLLFGSDGVRQIAITLDVLGIPYELEKSVPGCVNSNGRHLPFDFSISVQGKDILVEYDGRQHDKVVKTWGGNKAFQKIKNRDRVKDLFAREKGITLIRVSHQTKNIPRYLVHELSEATGLTVVDLFMS